ncbi:hypothetical protein BDZ45DRAFT_744497 [Acephala macrosclerotiorum]|nr:hypothetical protein BDZ45DRAFT_744497 [Acephala macrosclerotiorum]
MAPTQSTPILPLTPTSNPTSPQPAPTTDLDTKSSSTSPRPTSTSPAPTKPPAPPGQDTLLLAILGYLAACVWVAGMRIWNINLGIVDSKRNSVLLYGIGAVNVWLLFLILKKERKGKNYLLGILLAPLLGIVVGSLLVRV